MIAFAYSLDAYPTRTATAWMTSSHDVLVRQASQASEQPHPELQPRFGGRTPVSHSSDLGETWTYSASEFPVVSSAQRLPRRHADARRPHPAREQQEPLRL